MYNILVSYSSTRFFYRLKKKKVEAQKYPEIKQLLSIAEAQIAPRLRQLKLNLTPMKATLSDEYATDRLNSSPPRKINYLKINRPGGTNY